MPMINLKKRSHVSSPLVEDIRIDSLRNRLLSLFKRTDDFCRNDYYMRMKVSQHDRHIPDMQVLSGLLCDWNTFRDDCRSVPFCRFRLLHRLRLKSWTEAADEQVAKLYGLCTSQVLLARAMLQHNNGVLPHKNRARL
ncbi:TPA: hypothetical protein G9F27_005804 [Salmonella enterica]|uniref:Uncharacterized protein n=1 Tax=Salmonella enterica TaxID=28901 RepID=A0A743ST47_SALER|nr:hypothetical protein [Salmonella enterica]